MMRRQIVGWAGGVLWMSAVIAMAAPLDCTVEWQRRIALDAAVAGSVSAVKVIPSQRVTKGAVLVTLDSVPLQLAMKRVNAKEEVLAAQVADGHETLVRSQQLYAEGSLSGVALAEAVAVARRSKLEHRRVVLKREGIRHRLALTEVRAPFDATVIDLHIDLGQYVNPKAFRRPLLTLAAVDRYVAVLAMPFVRLGDVALGQRLKVVTHEGPREGTVVWKALEPSVAQTAGGPALYAVHVQFESEGQALRVGTSCQVLAP
jgi:RND family efflux transporter MFP subunit